MRINSDFKDYYDGLMATDDDKITVYQRFAKTIEIPKSEWLKYKQFSECLLRPEYSIIGFAGELYPLIVINDPIKPFTIKTIYYDKEKYLNRNSETRRIDAYFTSYGGKTIEDFFNINNSSLKKDLFDLLGPIFILKYNHIVDRTLTDNPSKIEQNICLDKYGFAKILPPYLVYNNLKLFVNNMTHPTKPIPEMDNETKIVLAGFNTKTSFRKKKEK